MEAPMAVGRLDAKSGRALWWMTVPVAIAGTPRVVDVAVVDDAVIVSVPVLDDTGFTLEVFAFARENGGVRWSTTADPMPIDDSFAMLDAQSFAVDGTLLVTIGQQLWLLDTDDGTLRSIVDMAEPMAEAAPAASTIDFATLTPTASGALGTLGAVVALIEAPETTGPSTTVARSTTTSVPAAVDPADELTEPAPGCVVGVSWGSLGGRLTAWDEPAMKAAVEAGGGTYLSTDANFSPDTQAANVDDLLARGANVLVIFAQDGTAIEPSVATAISGGVPVIAYDRLIDNPDALYISFDAGEVGRLGAEAVFSRVPNGNYVIIKGDPADANSDLLRSGYEQVIGEAVTSGNITIVGETYTDYWDPATARAEMEQFLTANNNDVDAVLVENDGMAGGVIEALEAQGLAGTVAVSGQDGDEAALNRIALGTQTVSVWKDARELGQQAGQAAIQLCQNSDLTKIAGSGTFTTPSNNRMTSILFPSTPITKDNFDLVIDAGWIDQSTLCRGVATSSVTACS
jgi:D-xylose transport system substrate-binding protein